MKRYAAYWLMAHVVAVLMLWAAMAIMNAGCSRKQTRIDIAPEPVPKKDAPVTQIRHEPNGGGIVMNENKPASGALLATVYFEFDDARLRPAEAMKLDNLLGGNGGLRIEGHACIYGSNEYNIGLGQRRADVVRRYIGRGTAISWGEEKCTAACGSIDEPECRECRKAEVYAE